MRNWTVYLHINKINNKKYVGITCLPLELRWGKNGNGYKKQVKFYRAIKKYGWDNFEHIVLFTNLSEIAAKQKERELIKKYNTTSSKFGYNVTIGGDGYTKYETKEEAIAADRQNTRQWYLDHRQEQIAKATAYAKDHTDEIKEYRQIYNIQHAKYFKAKNKANYEKQKTKWLADKKIYYKENRDSILAYKSKLGQIIKALRAEVISLNKKYPNVLDQVDIEKLKYRDTCRNKAYLENLLKKFSDLNLK